MCGAIRIGRGLVHVGFLVLLFLAFGWPRVSSYVQRLGSPASGLLRVLFRFFVSDGRVEREME